MKFTLSRLIGSEGVSEKLKMTLFSATMGSTIGYLSNLPPPLLRYLSYYLTPLFKLYVTPSQYSGLAILPLNADSPRHNKALSFPLRFEEYILQKDDNSKLWIWDYQYETRSCHIRLSSSNIVEISNVVRIGFLHIVQPFHNLHTIIKKKITASQ